MEQSAHEGAGGNDDGFGPIDHAKAGADAGDDIVFHQDLSGVALMHVEVGLIFDQPFHAELVSFLVALSPWSLNAGTFLSVEHAELDAGGVGVQAHHTAESIDLADHVSLGQATNCWIAGHLRDRIEILREDCRLATESSRSHRCLHASMASAADDHIVVFGKGVHERMKTER